MNQVYTHQLAPQPQFILTFDPNYIIIKFCNAVKGSIISNLASLMSSLYLTSSVQGTAGPWQIRRQQSMVLLHEAVKQSHRSGMEGFVPVGGEVCACVCMCMYSACILWCIYCMCVHVQMCVWMCEWMMAEYGEVTNSQAHPNHLVSKSNTALFQSYGEERGEEREGEGEGGEGR